MGRARTDPGHARAGSATVGLGGIRRQCQRRLLVRDLQRRDELRIIRRDAQGLDASPQETLDVDPRQLACPQGQGREQLRRVDRWKAGIALLAGLRARTKSGRIGVESYEKNWVREEPTRQGGIAA